MVKRRILFLIFGDILVLFLSYVLSSVILRRVGILPPLDLDLFLLVENGLVEIGGVVLTIVFGLYFMGLYDRVRVRSVAAIAQDLLLVFGVAFLVQALVSYSKAEIVLARWAMLGGSLSAAISLMAWRFAYTQILLRRAGRARVLFLGDSPLVRRIAAFIHQNPEAGFEVIGYVSSLAGNGFPAGEHIQLDGNLEQTIRGLFPDRVAVAENVDLDDLVRQQLLECSMAGFSVESVGTLHEDLYERVAIETVTINQLVFSPSFRPRPWVVFVQEIYSRLIALLGVVLTSPLMLIAAIAVRVDSGSPILFRQIRLGRDGVPFVFLKFRSMQVDADRLLGGPVRAKQNDPRITRVGRWIRLTRIDELPQFFNVLRGDMTLVGPRPEMPEFEADLVKQIPLYTQRHRVKPGITGWAQIHHEPEDSLDSTVKKLEYDLYYIKNMSPALDFFTMFHTVKAILLRVGAR